MQRETKSKTTTEAARKLAIQIEASEDLFFFSRYMFFKRRKYKWLQNHHHKAICDALMRVFRGECKRLIINLPPRYSKTELAVVNFIAWAMGKVPDSEFIHVSYSATLAANNSAQVKNLVQEPDYLDLFPKVMVSSDTSAKDHWKTTEGGVLYAAGTGGTLTGFGAGKERDSFGGAIIIDDPHKASEARSDKIRQGVIDWFQETLQSRVNSANTPIIVIMQRLHERDLAGWLLDGGNGEEWEHLCLPAIQADGTALWPHKHTISDLNRMKTASPYMFSGQYDQRPSPAEGGFFKPDMMPVVDAIPAGVRLVRGWDFAGTIPAAGKDPDWTVGAKLGVLPDGRFIIADINRFRDGPDVVQATLKNVADRDGKGIRISLPQDPGQAGKYQMQAFVRLLSGYSVTATPESGDKVTRAEALAAQVNVGNVLLLRGDWNDALISEMKMFPNGAHDDQVDGCSRAFNELSSGNTGLLDHLKSKG